MEDKKSVVEEATKDPDQASWADYYEQTRGMAPHHTLQSALTLFEASGVMTGNAIDLGCGDGRDSLELLFRGWSVIAVDQEPEAVGMVRQRAGDKANRLECRIANFENTDLPQVMLVNASLSLPFCSKARFPDFWERIKKAIMKGGRFAGHFFGLNDDWAKRGTLICLSKEDVEKLFVGFQVEAFTEMENDFPGVDGKTKHWHIYHVVAQKK